MTDDILLPKAERTSNAILDAAYELFTTQGYAATSMRQIAEKTGLALGGIYNHFSSKEAIFETVIRKHHPFYLMMPHLLEATGTNVDEFLRNSAHRMVAELDQHPEFFNLMLTELVEFKGQHVAQMFERLYPDVMKITGRFEVFRDELRPIPRPLVIRAFAGMFFAYFITNLLLKNAMPADMKEDDLNRFVDIFLNGVKLPVNQPSTAREPLKGK